MSSYDGKSINNNIVAIQVGKISLNKVRTRMEIYSMLGLIKNSERKALLKGTLIILNSFNRYLNLKIV